jgi:hypothetical protein
LVVDADMLYVRTLTAVDLYALDDPSTPRLVRRLEVGMYLDIGVHALVAAGGYLYIGWEGETQIVDVSTQTEPRLVGRLPRVDCCLAVHGGYLLAEESQVPIWWDVHNPAAPRRLGRLPDCDSAGSATVAAGYLIIACRSSVANSDVTLHVMDISTPERPVMVTTRALGRDWQSVMAATGGSLFLPYDGILDVWDIRQAAEPRRVWQDVGAPDYSTDIELFGNVAYVSSGTGAIRMIDVANPAAPVAVGALPRVGNVPVMTRQGERLLLGRQWNDPGGGGTGRLTVFDVSRPADPQMLGDMVLEAGPRSLVADSRYAWAVLTNGRMIAVDLADPCHPSIAHGAVAGISLGRLVADGRRRLLGMVHGQGVQVIDIADPMQPTDIGLVAIPGASDLAVNGDVAYVLANEDMVVLDLHGGSMPMLLSRTRVFDRFAQRTLSWAGGHLYVLGAELMWLELSEPTRPIILEFAGGVFGASAVAGSADRLMLAARNNGLFIGAWAGSP